MVNEIRKFFYTYKGPNGEAPSEEILNTYRGFVFDETNRVMYANKIPYTAKSTGGNIDLSDYVKNSELTNKLTNLKSEILGGAGEDYDTLKEIEEWVLEHQDIYQALVSTVSQKSTKEELQTVETNVLDELGKKSNVHVCDNQYEFDNILTKDNNTIYLIKGDQDVWAAKEYVDELYDLMVELRGRITVLESRYATNVERNDEEITEEDIEDAGKPIAER